MVGHTIHQHVIQLNLDTKHNGSGKVRKTKLQQDHERRNKSHSYDMGALEQER